jgi:uncharacterized protein involved in exopolysaccharide biosynthesis
MTDRNANSPEPSGAPNKTQKLLRAALFFAGSAMFGGLAVALWDRKALTAMRRREAESTAPPAWRDDEEIY